VRSAGSSPNGRARDPWAPGSIYSGRKRDGREFPIEISLSPLATSDGMLFSASIRDISERKQADAVVRRSQAHLLSAVESIQGAFAIFDGADRLVLCNSSYRQLVARRLSERSPVAASES
jgi:PAS domain-containing protein